jgi:hypothetical protein
VGELDPGSRQLVDLHLAVGSGVLRRVLAVQSFILGWSILIFVLFFARAGDSATETLKACGVVLGLAIYLALCLRVIQLLKAPRADGRASAIAMFLCVPPVALVAFQFVVPRLA